MQDQIEKYRDKLVRDGVAAAENTWFYAMDDQLVVPEGDPLAGSGETLLQRIHSAGILLIRPREPWAHLLARRLGDGCDRILPRDSETKTFFHDIPIVRDRGADPPKRAELIGFALEHRKSAVLTSGLIASRASITLEQAYIALSSVIHACFVAYHLDLLARGYLLPGEATVHEAALEHRRKRPRPDPSSLRDGPLAQSEVRQQMVEAGRMTVLGGLVDSFFGNISYTDGKLIWISRTASSLDELEDAIDPVPLDGSSTVGLTASSEYPAHRAIYEGTNCRAILHGHPKFSVVASMICSETGCGITDCGKHCDRVRRMPLEEAGAGHHAPGLPIVAGEIGAGGLAKTVPPVIDQCGAALVYGHGLFAVGTTGFREAMERMVMVEQAAEDWVLKQIPRGQ